jgi:YHS domain-containing protein
MIYLDLRIKDSGDDGCRIFSVRVSRFKRQGGTIMKIKLRIISLAAAIVMLFSMATPAFAAGKSEIYTNWLGIAIKGYDPVAFYTAGKPIKGSATYELTWKDATWRFSSADNRERFKADPEKYAPQYGGYCAWAISQGTTAGVDPKNAWNIIDDKLYLNYNTEIKEKWEKDIPGNIQKADVNWPDVLNQ